MVADTKEHLLRAVLSTESLELFMIQLILLVLGIIAAIRYPKLKRLTHADYPEVEPGAFSLWLETEKSATCWLIAATIGVFILQLVGGFALGFAMAASEASHDALKSAELTFTIGSVALFLGLLIVAAVQGSKARKLKTAAGIIWPKK